MRRKRVLLASTEHLPAATARFKLEFEVVNDSHLREQADPHGIRKQGKDDMFSKIMHFGFPALLAFDVKAASWLTEPQSFGSS